MINVLSGKKILEDGVKLPEEGPIISREKIEGTDA